MLVFQPREPGHTAGRKLHALRVHVRDHTHRDLPMRDRTLEAHYGAFVLSQAHRGTVEAKRLALKVSYGADPRRALIAGHEARVYELGPAPLPDDIDGRSPAVVAWTDGNLFYLIGSGELPADTLVEIAQSLY